MSITIRFIDGPIPPLDAPPAPHADSAGAFLSFDGIVRPLEDGRPLLALDYQHYQPMAERQLAALAADTLATHNLISLSCTHSRGRVPAGHCSLRVIIHAAHRAEALAAMAAFIDRLKRDVPIWKHPVWAPHTEPQR